MFGFLWLSDAGDVEVHNGEATYVEYTERYYTESEDKDGKKTTTWHGPYYNIFTSNGEEISTDSGVYHQYIARWGGSGRVTSRSNPSADGPIGASIHKITWDGRQETRVPTAKEHPYINYVKGSSHVLRTQVEISGYRDFLAEYPRVHGGPLGKIEQNRVIVRGTAVNPGFEAHVNEQLAKALMTLGKQRQCNILIYVVGADEGFFAALETAWGMGKKNDICVVIGKPNQKIEWVRVLCYTDNELFREKISTEVRHLGTLDDNGEKLCQTVLKQVTAENEAGFKRKSMKDYKFLAADVHLPFWAFCLVFLVTVVGVLPTVYLCIVD
jgi:hypothetical protein